MTTMKYRRVSRIEVKTAFERRIHGLFQTSANLSGGAVQLSHYGHSRILQHHLELPALAQQNVLLVLILCNAQIGPTGQLQRSLIPDQHQS